MAVPVSLYKPFVLFIGLELIVVKVPSRVEPEAVYIILFNPVEDIGYQETFDFTPAEIKIVCVPGRVHTLRNGAFK
jgi:hypothetical protein